MESERKSFPITTNVENICHLGEITSSDSIDNTPILKPTTTITEEGVLLSQVKVSVLLYFEHAPIWLLALNPRFIDNIFIGNHLSFSTILHSIPPETQPLFNSVVQTFGLSVFHFTKPPAHSTHITLVSGSIDYLMQHQQLLFSPFALGIVDSYFRVKKLPRSPLRFVRLKHKDLGGATTFESLATVGFSPTLLSTTRVSRNIRDFMDSKSIPHSFSHPPQSVSHHSLLPFQNLSCPVSFDWNKKTAYRSLTLSELGAIFGFSRSLPLHLTSQAFSSIIPIQLLDHLLQPVLHQFNDDSSSSPSLRFCPPPYVEPPTSYIPALDRHIPIDWRTDVATSSTSAKNDDAEVVIKHWNLRILPLFPQTRVNKYSPSQALDKFRSFIVFINLRRLYREFRCYMRSTHPTLWDLYVHKGYRYHDTKGGEGSCFACPKPGYNSSCLFEVHPSAWTLPNINNTELDFCWEMHLGRNIIYKASIATGFDWGNGSTLIFWRWPKAAQQFVKGSAPPFTWHSPPSFQRTPRPIDPEFKHKAWEKLEKLLRRGYLEIIPNKSIKSYINYFLIDKGTSDKRFVLSATNCGLNPSVWAPTFWLPFSSTMVRLLHFGWKAIDIDLGEMFLNFPIHRLLLAYSGIDLTQFRAEIEKDFPELIPFLETKIGAVFLRTFFGYRLSPIIAAMFFYLAEEFVRGNPADESNELRWDKVILNLFGDPEFNPALPNVYKWCSIKDQIAADLIAYVDDLRALGLSYEQAWAVAHQVTSRLQYLGMQDAPRKRRLDNGPWAGGVYSTNNGEIAKCVTQKKWEKGKKLLADVRQELRDSGNNTMSYKTLERVRGFFCHLAMVYDIFFPYLKGFHLTLAAHLPNRDREGWKMKEEDWYGYVQGQVENGKLTQEEADDMIDSSKQDDIKTPERVTPVADFFEASIGALEEFMKIEEPPKVIVRRHASIIMMYGFLDASGSGFGSSLLRKNNVYYRIGTWNREESENSSNWKEFSNLVNDFIEAGKKGWLRGNTILLATDNATVEQVFYKGNSTDKKLYELVLKLRQAELKYGARLIISHVSGLRMIAQGTDGLSRGNKREGVSLGIDMMNFCPWNKSALEVQPKLKTWLKSWLGPKAIFLEPQDWFQKGHDIIGYEKKGLYQFPIIQHGCYVWTPPPAAADVAIEELRKARIKRQKSTHLIVIPKLLASQWMKQLYKTADCITFCPPMQSFWTKSNYEHLCIAFVFPFLNFRPYQLRQTPKMFSMGRELSELFKKENMADWSVLHEFWRIHERLSTMQRDMVWKLLYYGNEVPFSYSYGRGKDKQLEKDSKSKRRARREIDDDKRESKKLRR